MVVKYTFIAVSIDGGDMSGVSPVYVDYVLTYKWYQVVYHKKKK